jgi:hypothetical protein
MYVGIIDSATNKLYFRSAEVMPSFADSTIDLNKFFLDNLNLPSKKCSKSEIVISFAVEPNSEITHKKIIKKPDCLPAKDIMIVLDKIPLMKPGKIKKAVMPVIVEFRIEIPKYNKSTHSHM